MPGSLPDLQLPDDLEAGEVSDEEEDEEDVDDDDALTENGGDDDELDEMFDEDLLATGEMKDVPFL
jgi:hypothetical protein